MNIGLIGWICCCMVSFSLFLVAAVLTDRMFLCQSWTHTVLAITAQRDGMEEEEEADSRWKINDTMDL